nr:hypothetical protein [Tanacetum cinerariifolium]
MPKVLLQAWEKFFAIQHAQPEDTNELFQKLLEYLQIINEELAEYINSLSWNHPIFFNNNEEHSVQYKEYLENSSNEIAASNFNQEKEEPPQNSDIRQLVREECGIEVCEKQKKNMEDTLLELLEEVKNIVEQPTKHGTRIAESLQNFRVKKISTSLNNTSQISLVHAIAPVLPTEEPEYSLCMGYEHLSTIPSEYEVTSDNESECDVPICEDSLDVLEDHYEILSDSNNDDTSSNGNAFEDIEYVEASLPDSELERLTSVVLKDISNDSSNDPLLEKVDLFLASDNSIPPGIGNIDYDSEGDIHFLEELLVDNSIPLPKNKLSDFDH